MKHKVIFLLCELNKRQLFIQQYNFSTDVLKSNSIYIHIIIIVMIVPIFGGYSRKIWNNETSYSKTTASCMRIRFKLANSYLQKKICDGFLRAYLTLMSGQFDPHNFY